ncbi:MAG: helix-turn-helix transcriptional regulator [Elusimicrobiota bacterium]
MLQNYIRKLRFEANDITQEALAEAVGVTRQTIIAIEKGNYVPSLLLALTIARFFKKNVEEIFYVESPDVDFDSKIIR